MRRLLIAILLLLPLLTIAQEKVAKWGIKTSPQHMLVSTLRFEVERVLTEKAISLTLAPYMVWGDVWEDHPTDKISGGGAELSGRIYFAGHNRNMKGAYASYGFNYTYYNITVNTMDWNPSQEDGLEILKYEWIEKPTAIHKGGIVFTMGYQFNIRNVLLIDLYSGFGLKKSYSSQGDFVLKRYDDHVFDLAYSGLDPRIGCKIGFVL